MRQWRRGTCLLSVVPNSLIAQQMALLQRKPPKRWSRVFLKIPTPSGLFLILDGALVISLSTSISSKEEPQIFHVSMVQI